MNDKLSNIKTVKKLFSEHSSKPTDILLEAISNFFNKMTKDYILQISKKVEIICMNDEYYKKYSIPKDNSKTILINFGNLNDLNISSITGLVAHLFALIDIGDHEKTSLSPQEWLKIDLSSDDIACGWGFENEVNDLRKIRPQKIPCEIKYPDIIVNGSVSNKKFESDIFSLSNNYTNPSGKIWYIDRFSVLCVLSNLRKRDVKNIHILTDNYMKKEVEQLFQQNLI